MGMADARKKKAQIVIDFGHGAHGRPGVMRGPFLIDGYGGAQSFDVVNVRLLHSPQELAGIGGKRLHIAALALGIDGIVFVLDNTGSIAGRIQAIKDSISAFALTLEAAGLDARFGVISFGDITTESESLDLPATAEAVSTWLDALSGVNGNDTPENALDAVMKAHNDFSWRSGTQKIFVLIIDTVCHQLADGTTFTDRTVASVEAALSGIASVYAVSPRMDVTGPYYNDDNDPLYYPGTGDVRWLADGYGYFTGVTSETYMTNRPYSGTGGLWVELPASGNIDLTTLGISSLLSSGVTVRFSYTFSAGTWYIHVLVDTNGDGTFDSELMITIVISGSSGVSVSSELQKIKGIPGPPIN
jgi:hypothetical protein